MNIKELEEEIRRVNPKPNVDNVLRLLEEKEQEINPAPKV
jgi:hypothetical protein